ncbi:MAG: rod-binding protein [Pseudomonadota bacterium]
MNNISPDTALAVMQSQQAQVSSKATELQALAKAKNNDRLDVVAKDFEAMFIAEMMKPMFEGIKPNQIFGGGKTEEVFSGVLLQEYGKLMAETGQLGIADNIKAELIRMQEDAVDTTTLLQQETQEQ